MTALPPATDFTGASITEGQFKTAMTSMRAFLSELLGTSGTDKVAALTAMGAILGDSLDKTGAYTVVAADKGKVINCTTGTWSLSLTAAATLGDGFAFAVWNNGAGTITIDPNASELIDGATTKTLAAGKLAIVYCDGAKFVTVGSIATGSGSGLDADLLDGYQANNLPYAGANKNFDWELVGTVGVSQDAQCRTNWGEGIYTFYNITYGASYPNHWPVIITHPLGLTGVQNTVIIDSTTFYLTPQIANTVSHQMSGTLNIYKLRKLS